MMKTESDIEIKIESDIQIRKNIQQTYLYKLQEVTRQLRTMEKEYLVRMKDLYGEEGEVIIEQFERREREYFNLNEGDEKRIKTDLIQVQDFTNARSGDITKLVSQINELAVIFKELSILVVEQGTLLDRIDYNIEATKINIQKTNVELTKTVQSEKSFRAKGCMICLVQTIIIMTGVLILKHY